MKLKAEEVTAAAQAEAAAAFLRSASSIGAFVCAWVEYNALNCYMQHAGHRGGGLHLAC